MTTESDQSSDTVIKTPMITRFEELDFAASGLKDDAKMLGGIAAFSSITYTALAGFGGFSSEIHPFFDFGRIPLWALIVGPLITGAALIVSYRLCKMVDQKTAESKTAYRNRLEVIAAHTDLVVDDSGPEPVLRKVL